MMTNKLLKSIENVVHLVDPNTEYIKKYTIERLHHLMMLNKS